MLKTEVLLFEELNTEQLYDLLQLRSEVFVVEQDCVYQDVDDKDQKAFHVILKKSEEIIGYTRLFWPGDYFKVKFYFEDCWGHEKSHEMRKYVGYDDENIFYFRDVNSESDKYCDWRYEVSH